MNNVVAANFCDFHTDQLVTLITKRDNTKTTKRVIVRAVLPTA
jgi:sortase (surface protein transpeptidase)